MREAVHHHLPHRDLAAIGLAAGFEIHRRRHAPDVFLADLLAEFVDRQAITGRRLGFARIGQLARRHHRLHRHRHNLIDGAQRGTVGRAKARHFHGRDRRRHGHCGIGLAAHLGERSTCDVEARRNRHAIGRQAGAIGLFGAVRTFEAACAEQRRHRTSDNHVIAIARQGRRRCGDRGNGHGEGCFGTGCLRACRQQRPGRQGQREREQHTQRGVPRTNLVGRKSQSAQSPQDNSRKRNNHNAPAHVAQMPAFAMMGD